MRAFVTYASVGLGAIPSTANISATGSFAISWWCATVTKDEHIARLMALVESLTQQLAEERENRRPRTGAERTAKWRDEKRHAASHGSDDVRHISSHLSTEQRHTASPLCDEIASPPPIESTSTSSTSLLGNGSTDPLKETKRNSLSETVTQNVTKRHTYQEFDVERARADALARGLSGEAFEAELQRFTDYWDSAGWRRKNGPVKDRNATWRSWLDSPYRQKAMAKADGKTGVDRALEERQRRRDQSTTVIEGEFVPS